MELISVAKNGEYLEVHPTTLDQHLKLGWKQCDKRDSAEMSYEEAKAALTAAGIDFPVNISKKAAFALLSEHENA